MLELKNIRFDVQEGSQEIEIIRDVSFTIPDNKFVVITGPNGGGKSTLARLIAGIEKPCDGAILLDGEDITDVSIRWGVTASAIRELNNLGENDKLKAGQVLRLPADAQQN